MTIAEQLPDAVHFGRATCCDLEQASRREWWLANGLGGYAGGTIAQCLTRRYHGLLIAPAYPSPERLLVFAKADATLHDNGRSWPLFTNCWGSGAVEPRGFIHLESFRLDGSLPVWRFAIGDLVVEQCIWMERDQHTTCIAWRLVHAVERPVYLGIDLLVNNRSHHGESGSYECPAIDGDGKHISVRHLSGPTLHFRTDDGQLFGRHQWIKDFDLPRERERGFPDRDSHLCAAHMRLQLRSAWSGLIATITTTLAEGSWPHCAELLRRRLAYDADLLAAGTAFTPELRDAPRWIHQLVVAANSFTIMHAIKGREGQEEKERHGLQGESIIAGYPWFSDWGRDTHDRAARTNPSNWTSCFRP